MPREALRVRLLGDFRVEAAGGTIPAEAWQLPASRALIALLALAPDHARPLDAICDALWPGSAPDMARAQLDHALAAARQVLGIDCLRARTGAIALAAPGGVETDVGTFKSAAARARQTQAPPDFRAAIAAYSGDLLPAEPAVEWVEQARDELRATLVALHAELAARLDELDDATAVAAWERILAFDQAHEAAHCAIIRHLAATGRRAAALRQYAHLRDALQRSRGAEPSAESQRLHAALLSGQAITTQRLARVTRDAAAPISQTNLPIPLTTFVGRQRELAELAPLLTPASARSRLITLTGPGGTGKTRLALEVVRQLPPHHRDGIRLVDLAPVTDPERVVDAVARAVGVREETGTPLLTTLRTALAGKVMLLVLDNCEHLLASCATLAGALLRAATHLYLLATSRAPLGVPGEHVWRVAPLALPRAGASTPAAVAQSDAVMLLLERVRVHAPDFGLTPANAPAIAAICRRLDGLPLALELVAGQLPTLAPDVVVARLDTALELLVGNRHSSAKRQQTLRTTLDWSYALLDAAEAVLFRRLAVFAGGWSLAGAEVVCTDPATVTTGALLDLLTRLVDKSLVAVASTSQGTRYRLLEPVRQYAAEYLGASGEAPVTGERHARYMLTLVGQAQQGQTGPHQGTWLAALARDEDNLRVALRWCLDNRATDLGWRLGSALWRYWLARGQLAEGRTWLAALLNLDGTPTSARADVLHGAAALNGVSGDSATAARCATEVIAIRRALHDQQGLASALNNLGVFYLRNQGDFERAGALFTEALELNRALGNQPWAALNLNNLGVVAAQRGDPQRALALQEESLAIYQDLGLDTEAHTVLLDLGDALHALHQYERAVATYRQGIAFLRAAGAQFWHARAVLGLGSLLLERGDLTGARACLAEALTLARTSQAWHLAVGCLDQLAILLVASDQPTIALRFSGATAAAHGRTGQRRLPDQQRRVDQATRRARAALGDDAALAAWEAGQALSIEEASAEALRLLATSQQDESAPALGSLSERG